MKLPTSIALASLFWAVSLATITLEDVPSELRAGSEYYINWTQDLDYRLWDFYLVHEEDGGDWWTMVEVVDHTINYREGVHELRWEVPAVKDDGYYKLWVHGVDNTGGNAPDRRDYLNETGYGATSNHFKIVGGPTMYKNEIAWVVGGTLAALVLLIGTAVVAAKVWRKRREGAVALS